MTDLETQLRSLAVDRPEPAGSGEIRRRAQRRRRRRRGYVLGGIGLGAVALAFGLISLTRDTASDQRVATEPTRTAPPTAFTLGNASEIGVEPSVVFDRLGGLRATPDWEGRLYRPDGSESLTDSLVLVSEEGGGGIDGIGGELVDLGGVDGVITLDAWPTVMWESGGRRHALGGGGLDLDELVDAARDFVAVDDSEDIDGWTLIARPELRDLAHPLSVSPGGPVGWAGTGYVETPGEGAVVLAWAPGDEDRLEALVATAAERTQLDDGSWLLDGRRSTPGAGIYTVRSGHIVAILAVAVDDERLVDLAANVDSNALSEFEGAVARDGLGPSEPPFDLLEVLGPQTAPEPVALRADVAGTGIEATASDALYDGGLDLQLSIGNSGTSFTVPDPERRLVLTKSERIDGTLLTAVAGIAAPGLEGIEGTDPLTGETFEVPIIATEPLGDGRVLFLAVVEDRSKIPEAVTLDDDLGPTTFIPPG